MAESRAHHEAHSEELTAREARQARPGRPVLLILVASLAIAIVALIGLLTWQRRELPDPRPSVERSTEQPAGRPIAPPAR